MIEIRAAVAGDADGILECLHLAFEPYRAQYSPEGFSDTALPRETLNRRLSEMAVLVACNEFGEIVGTVAYNVRREKEGHLRGMAILPEAQGSGIAQQLLSEAESRLRALAFRRVTLDTTAPLQRAIRFYERHGYRASGKITDFFGMPLYEYEKPLE